ncbi:hypothetical protein [Paraconexibacter sp. AEG42_29]|uniref:hypothetical protein n=1 Tax=Paraconexibacter sp. AEG42_29 TaxID=2997339 RepID=UPI00339D55A4
MFFSVVAVVFVGVPLFALAISVARTTVGVLARRRAERAAEAAPEPAPRPPAAVSRPIGASAEAELKVPGAMTAGVRARG